MTDAGVGRGMAVVVVAVPAALVEKQLETALHVLIVVPDQLFLRKAVDNQEQDQLRRRLPAGSASRLGSRGNWKCQQAEDQDGKKHPRKRHDLLPVFVLFRRVWG